jgi:hypothetical protein
MMAKFEIYIMGNRIDTVEFPDSYTSKDVKKYLITLPKPKNRNPFITVVKKEKK